MGMPAPRFKNLYKNCLRRKGDFSHIVKKSRSELAVERMMKIGSGKARVNGELQQQPGSSSCEIAHSSRSNISELSTESCSSPPDDITCDSASPTQQQPNEAQNGDGQEEEKSQIVDRRKKRQRMDKVGRQIDINANAIPTSPAIRVSQSQPSFYQCYHQNGDPSTAAAADDAEKNNTIVHIRVGRLHLLEHSPLLHPGYDDGGQVFVEWNFLDIAKERCEKKATTARLPRHHSEQIHFDQQRAYELNSKRVALLKQWTELDIRLTFTLVLEDPAENGESDDLCMGELDLMEVLNGSQHTLIMHNVDDNMATAVLEVEVEYSEPLMQQIREAILMQQIREAIDDTAEEEDESESVVEA